VKKKRERDCLRRDPKRERDIESAKSERKVKDRETSEEFFVRDRRLQITSVALQNSQRSVHAADYCASHIFINIFIYFFFKFGALVQCVKFFFFSGSTVY